MDRHRALPHLVEIAAFGCVGSAECNDLKAARSESRGERTPTGWRPLLVSEHRGGVDHRIRARWNLLNRRCRRANHLGYSRDAERVDKPKHLLDAVDARHVGHAAMKQAALDQMPEPGPGRVGQAGMGSAREHSKDGRPVAGLGRDRQMISLEQSRHECGGFGNRRSHRRDDDAIDIWVAFDDAGGAGIRQHVNVSRRARRDADCGSAASSAAHRQCAAARPPECVNGLEGRVVAAHASRAFYSHWAAFQIGRPAITLDRQSGAQGNDRNRA